MVVRRLTSVCHGLTGWLGAPRPWRLAGLGLALLALALAVGEGLAQCARCSPSQPVAVEPAMPKGLSVERPWRQARQETAPRHRLAMSLAAAGGNYNVCVRACDGSFFPVTYTGAASRAYSLEEICRSLCPNAQVALYSFPFGGTIDEAVSANGEPYSLLPNAHKFEQSFDPSCSCRARGQSWAEALAAAEAKFGGQPHDLLVTAKDAERLSRPVAGKAKPAVAGPEPDAAAPVEPPPGLDINGVDKALSAAAKALSRETSGIRDEEAQGPASFGPDQGRIVEETGPDGSTRKVRILPAAF